MLYRGMDRATLDAVYNNTAAMGRGVRAAVGRTIEHASEFGDKLAERFLNADKYPFRQPEKRLIVHISVDRIGGFGPKMQRWS